LGKKTGKGSKKKRDSTIVLKSMQGENMKAGEKEKNWLQVLRSRWGTMSRRTDQGGKTTEKLGGMKGEPAWRIKEGSGDKCDHKGYAENHQRAERGKKSQSIGGGNRNSTDPKTKLDARGHGKV